MIAGMDILKLDNEKLIDILPKVGIMMQLSGLAKMNAQRKNGVPSWQVNNVITDAIQSLQVNQVNQTSGFGTVLGQLFNQQSAQPVQPAGPTSFEQKLLDRFDKIDKSNYSMHKRLDAVELKFNQGEAHEKP